MVVFIAADICAMLVTAGAGGLHRSRGGFMLVMHGDGVLTCGRHVRGAAGASDGRQRQPRSHLESWWPFIAAKIA